MNHIPSTSVDMEMYVLMTMFGSCADSYLKNMLEKMEKKDPLMIRRIRAYAGLFV